MCPVNRLGHIDLLVVSHHGWYQSSSRALVDAITPRVAVMDNGAIKGGSIPVLDTLRADPSHPALWQLHYSIEGGAAHNTPDTQIANLSANPSAVANPQQNDAGFLVRATVAPSGSIAVWNSRTGQQKQYPPH
jgi:competence protein ComEC